jgi:dTDP-4-dehydrorhamnose 3,5-epimerase-like enzyme
MFPPHVTPPGVHPSEDGLDLATPVTLLEWFTSFYAEACREHRGVMKECVCREGEMMFVPRGWWHLVLNIEDSVAITQNYVSSVSTTTHHHWRRTHT